MKLFFETGIQAVHFLGMVPLGFAAALFIELGGFFPVIRPMTDVLVFLAAGIAILVSVALGQENAVRLYHLLGLLTGMLIWTQGIGKIIRIFKRRQELKRSAAN